MQSYQRFQCIGHTVFNTSGTNAPRSLSHSKAGTHSAFGEKSHTAAHTAKQGAFRMGALSLPSERSARSQTSPGRVSERCTLPLLGLGRGCSRRTQRACGAAPLGCGNLFFCYSVVIFAPLPVCQQLEFSIKTIRRPNVHCKTECILLQYSEKSLEWRRYTICPLSLFAMTSRK